MLTVLTPIRPGSVRDPSGFEVVMFHSVYSLLENLSLSANWC